MTTRRAFLRKLTDLGVDKTRTTQLDESDWLMVHRDGEPTIKRVRPSLVVPPIGNNDNAKVYAAYNANIVTIGASWTQILTDTIHISVDDGPCVLVIDANTRCLLTTGSSLYGSIELQLYYGNTLVRGATPFYLGAFNMTIGGEGRCNGVTTDSSLSEEDILITLQAKANTAQEANVRQSSIFTTVFKHTQVGW